MIRRIYYEDAVYHVIARGNNRQYVLKDDNDKESFLRSVSKYKERFGFKLFGFVLMDNHFHIVIRANKNHNISRIMQPILLSYSRKYRKNHQYTGHLWEGRFKSKPILGEMYIRECLEYIHENPVRAMLVKRTIDYIWSSARFYERLENNLLDELILIDQVTTSDVTSCGT